MVIDDCILDFNIIKAQCLKITKKSHGSLLVTLLVSTKNEVVTLGEEGGQKRWNSTNLPLNQNESFHSHVEHSNKY